MKKGLKDYIAGTTGQKIILGLIVILVAWFFLELIGWA